MENRIPARDATIKIEDPASPRGKVKGKWKKERKEALRFAPSLPGHDIP